MDQKPLRNVLENFFFLLFFFSLFFDFSSFFFRLQDPLALEVGAISISPVYQHSSQLEEEEGCEDVTLASLTSDRMDLDFIGLLHVIALFSVWRLTSARSQKADVCSRDPIRHHCSV